MTPRRILLLTTAAIALSWNAASASAIGTADHPPIPATDKDANTAVAPESKTAPATAPTGPVVAVAPERANASVLTDLKIYPSF